MVSGLFNLKKEMVVVPQHLLQENCLMNPMKVNKTVSNSQHMLFYIFKYKSVVNVMHFIFFS